MRWGIRTSCTFQEPSRTPTASLPDNGGTVLAIGSSGMAETFGEGSEQYSFRCILDTPYEAGSEIVITDAAGKELYRHTAAKKGASVVFSSPELVLGETYSLHVGEQTLEVMQDKVSVR